jgi:hypothetical protein
VKEEEDLDSAAVSFGTVVRIFFWLVAKMLYCEASLRLVTAIDNWNVRLNVTCQEPSQKLSTSIGLICCQILWVNSELTNMLEHTPRCQCLVTEQCRRRMDRQNDSAGRVDQIVVVVAQQRRSTFDSPARIWGLFGLALPRSLIVNGDLLCEVFKRGRESNYFPGFLGAGAGVGFCGVMLTVQPRLYIGLLALARPRLLTLTSSGLSFAMAIWFLGRLSRRLFSSRLVDGVRSNVHSVATLEHTVVRLGFTEAIDLGHRRSPFSNKLP